MTKLNHGGYKVLKKRVRTREKLTNLGVSRNFDG